MVHYQYKEYQPKKVKKKRNGLLAKEQPQREPISLWKSLISS